MNNNNGKNQTKGRKSARKLAPSSNSPNSDVDETSAADERFLIRVSFISSFC